MSAKLYALGRWCYRNGLRVLLIWLLIGGLLGAMAAVFHGRFNDSFEIPGSSSAQAMERLNMTFPEATAVTATAVIVAPDGTDINDLQSQVEDAIVEFEDVSTVDGDEDVTSPWFEYVSGQVSENNRAALVAINLNVEEMPNDAQREELNEAGQRVEDQLPEGTTVIMGGQAFDIEMPTVSVTEIAGVILSFVVLIVVLGSVTAATIPIVTALLGVGLSMAIMMMGTAITTIMSATPILAVMLGLALGIDYALFIFSRHRDQLREGMDAEESMARSIGTAGTAVVFAGLTNAIALTGMAVAGIPFLTVMGIFGSIAALFATLIAITLLPAFGGMMGERMRPKKKKAERAEEAEQADAEEAQPKRERFKLFPWWVGVTTRHPIMTIVSVVVVLGALTLPAANMNLSLPNAGHQPADRQARIAYDTIAEHFGPGYNGPLVITAGIIGSDDPLGLVEDMSDDIEAVPGIDRVIMAVPNENADTALIQIIPTTDTDDPATVETVERLRALVETWQDKYGVDADVTGMTAVQIDVTQRLGAAIWPFGILVVGLSLILLAAVFRSVWVPVKTAVGFVLSVGAAFGITTLVFNEGWFKEVINLDRTTPLISFLPIIMLAILFGLAMDYEVFIVSRIREAYVHGRSALQAIREGFVASGPVVTAAAFIMFAVFAFFVPTGMLAIKNIAFALAVGVAIDAFLIRMTFVPAVLALLGDKAWWMPRWLDKALPVFDMEGAVLTKELELAEWPGTDALIHAEEVVVEGILGPTSLDVRPGEVVGITGALGARTGAALALSGRLGVASGRARVAGQLLPESAGAIRRRTIYLDLARSSDPVAAIRRNHPADGGVIFLDGVDALGTDAERAAVADLAGQARQASTFALVLCASSPSVLDFIHLDGALAVTQPTLEGSNA